MLTEGWDANTVTHIMGLRAFGSQLLCEQVAGRALRRKSYFLQGYDKDGNPTEDKRKIVARRSRRSTRTSSACPSHRLKEVQSAQLDFNALCGNALDVEEVEKVSEYYHHSDGWTNRLIPGDSLLVMTSLLEREGMAGKVQCIYFDPPSGIKYGPNWQMKLNNRTVKDGGDADLSGDYRHSSLSRR